MPIELFPFRYRDLLTGRWINARYVASREEIAARYAQWEIIGPPELRKSGGDVFNPYRMMPNAQLRRLQEPSPEISPHRAHPARIDSLERFLVALFLRRYVTYCARRSRYDRMQGAARLLREITPATDSTLESEPRIERPRS